MIMKFKWLWKAQRKLQKTNKILLKDLQRLFPKTSLIFKTAEQTKETTKFMELIWKLSKLLRRKRVNSSRVRIKLLFWTSLNKISIRRKELPTLKLYNQISSISHSFRKLSQKWTRILTSLSTSKLLFKLEVKSETMILKKAKLL